MQTISLGPTGRTTTRLGFGCSSILGVLNRRQSLALLESAFEAGIRHFDTAPMYGYGEAESCLGEFLSKHPGEMTVTTKFGIPSRKSRGVMQLARGAVTPLVQRFPALKELRRHSRVGGQSGRGSAW
jgi:D-threo-aldose 1-dehydrogenase